MGTKQKVSGVSFDPETFNSLNNAASVLGVTRSAIVRMLVTTYLPGLLKRLKGV